MNKVELEAKLERLSDELDFLKAIFQAVNIRIVQGLAVCCSIPSPLMFKNLFCSSLGNWWAANTGAEHLCQRADRLPCSNWYAGYDWGNPEPIQNDGRPEPPGMCEVERVEGLHPYFPPKTRALMALTSLLDGELFTNRFPVFPCRCRSWACLEVLEMTCE